MQLAPDFSLILQVAVFIAVWVGLSRFAFGPLGEVLADRERRTVQVHHAAEAVIALAHADRARYDEAVRERRVSMAEEAERARRAAIEESNRQITAAREFIGQELAVHRAAVAEQVQTARRALGAEAEKIAAEMLGRIGTGKKA